MYTNSSKTLTLKKREYKFVNKIFVLNLSEYLTHIFPDIELNRFNINLITSNNNICYSNDEFKLHYSNSTKHPKFKIELCNSNYDNIDIWIEREKVIIVIDSEKLTAVQIEDLLEQIAKFIRYLLKGGTYQVGKTDTDRKHINKAQGKPPFYKCGLFWGIVGTVATVAGFIVSVIALFK